MKNTKTSNVTKKVWYVTEINNAQSIREDGIWRYLMRDYNPIITELEMTYYMSLYDNLFIPDYIAFHSVTHSTGSLKYLLVEIDAAGIKGKYLPDQGDNGNPSKYLRQISQFRIEPQYILNIEEKEVDMDNLMDFSNKRILGLREEAEINHRIQSTKTISRNYRCEVFSPRKKTLENRYYSEVRSTARLNSRIINYFQNQPIDKK